MSLRCDCALVDYRFYHHYGLVIPSTLMLRGRPLLRVTRLMPGWRGGWNLVGYAWHPRVSPPQFSRESDQVISRVYNSGMDVDFAEGTAS